VPAGEIERFVVEQIKAIGEDPAVLARTVCQARSQGQSSLVELEAEERMLQKELARHHADLRKFAAASNKAGEMAIAQEGVRAAEQRATELRDRMVALSGEIVDEREVEAALSVFDPVWDTLSPKEQARIIRLLVERVDYDGKKGTIAVTFRPNGIKTLAQQFEEAA
jgi:site-specific DNA recombinase